MKLKGIEHSAIMAGEFPENRQAPRKRLPVHNRRAGRPQVAALTHRIRFSRSRPHMDRRFTLRWLGDFLLYWSLAHALAFREAFGLALHPADVQMSRRLHQRLYGELPHG